MDPKAPHPLTLSENRAYQCRGMTPCAPLKDAPHGIPCSEPKFSQQVAGG